MKNPAEAGLLRVKLRARMTLFSDEPLQLVHIFRFARRVLRLGWLLERLLGRRPPVGFGSCGNRSSKRYTSTAPIVCPIRSPKRGCTNQRRSIHADQRLIG